MSHSAEERSRRARITCGPGLVSMAVAHGPTGGVVGMGVTWGPRLKAGGFHQC